MKWIDNLGWPTVILFALLLGLAPFRPEPHVVEKIRMLLEGTLHRPVDIFDLLLHGAPWILLALKGARTVQGKR
ncbi:MAG TPA: hypothetical protein ENK54_06435 [Thiotrichales bacterium]|nr:hypothetical protein [Thiotrichales bacterium]